MIADCWKKDDWGGGDGGVVVVAFAVRLVNVGCFLWCVFSHEDPLAYLSNTSENMGKLSFSLSALVSP